jgi:hypothetical protein
MRFGFGARLGLAAGDHHFGTCTHKPFSNGATDAARPAGYDGDPSSQVKQFLELLSIHEVPLIAVTS